MQQKRKKNEFMIAGNAFRKTKQKETSMRRQF